MKTYDEITNNVLEGAKIYRRKIRRTQYAVSAVAMSTACALGLTLYSNIEKVDRSQPEQPTDCYTEYASNLPTMNASNDPENGDILSSEPPTPTETISPEISPSAPSTSITATATAPPSSTDPKETTVPETTETAIPETDPIHTTAVVISTTAPPITTTAPPIQTTAMHTTAPPILTTEAIPETTEYIETTEPTTEWVEIIEETDPPIEPLTDPEPEPTELEELPAEEPTELPTETEEPTEELAEPPTEPTEEPTISELEALKEAYPNLQLSDEEWEVLFMLYSDSEMPFSFWYTMFGGTP